MRKVDWNNVNEAQDFDNPTPGAYIGVITMVEDVESKEYLKVDWDFAEGQYKGNNRETHDRAGFWPYAIIRSYKEKALPFFKAFKTALEDSNRGYFFEEDNLRAMVGKRIGVVLGEEEYEKKKGGIGKRLYVYQTRSVEAIQKGDFTVPELKKLQAADNNANAYYTPTQFAPVDDNDSELPF